eukprot:snap_masked-scaffold_5-processed-gene-12.40-mRNA-1 protein AED:1.00 eAED:1.00 QI:0/-1/0/0/-1/1/1/0/63
MKNLQQIPLFEKKDENHHSQVISSLKAYFILFENLKHKFWKIKPDLNVSKWYYLFKLEAIGQL